MRCRFNYLAIHDPPTHAGIESALDELMPRLDGLELRLNCLNTTDVENMELPLNTWLSLMNLHNGHRNRWLEEMRRGQLRREVT